MIAKGKTVETFLIFAHSDARPRDAAAHREGSPAGAAAGARGRQPRLLKEGGNMKKRFLTLGMGIVAAVLLITMVYMRIDPGEPSHEPADFSPAYTSEVSAEYARAGDIGDVLSEHAQAAIRLSEALYAPVVSTDVWTPYFTGKEPLWKYIPDAPWSLSTDGIYEPDQEPAAIAHQSLFTYVKENVNYAGCYFNVNGYLTVLLTNPTETQALYLAEHLKAPVWIVAAAYTYDTLIRAQEESYQAILSWISNHPDVSASFVCSGINEVKNRVEVSLHGSGIPKLLDAFDLPDCIDILYTPIIDASVPHDIPREPDTIWTKDGVTIRSARESYPVGTTFLLVSASHTVENTRLYAPDFLLSVSKYVNGEWCDISGDIFQHLIYFEIFDIPAGEEKTVKLEIATPETLGPGLYRALYTGHVGLGGITIDKAIAGINIPGVSPLSFEFTITVDAEPVDLP